MTSGKGRYILAALYKYYEEMQPEFDVIRAIVDARTSQNLTQKELSERTGMQISANWKMEQGIHLLAY